MGINEMLINFSVENWMSYRDILTLSMVAAKVATKSTRHKERIPKSAKNKIRILPVAAMHQVRLIYLKP
jgi:hypothetical protein